MTAARARLHDFTPLLGHEVLLDHGDGTSPLEILAVEPLDTASEGDDALAFRVKLCARDGWVAPPTGTFVLEHPTRGRLDVELSPLETGADGMCYEARFG